VGCECSSFYFSLFLPRICWHCTICINASGRFNTAAQWSAYTFLHHHAWNFEQTLSGLLNSWPWFTIIFCATILATM
jgi:hypothetical protein